MYNGWMNLTEVKENHAKVLIYGIKGFFKKNIKFCIFHI